jgi:KDO2-lipid IV(A) lauroyltransferase
MKFRPVHYAEYLVFQAAGFFVRLLPLKYVHRAGFMLATVFYPILASRKKVALRNLHNAFPEITDGERKKIARNSFRNVGATFMGLLWHENFTKESILERVKIENFDLARELLKKGKGLIFLTAHFGSWELASQAFAVETGVPMYVVAKRQSNLYIDRVITKWRELFGIRVILMGINIRELLKALHAGGIVGLIADQSAPKESIAVDFFGRQVPTFEGPAVLSLKTGAPLVFGCAVRKPDGNYTMQLAEVPCSDLKDASDRNVAELTRRQVKMLEDIIRQYPEQWMWMHKRWKHVADMEWVEE